METQDKARLHIKQYEAEMWEQKASLCYLQIGFDSRWFPPFEVLTPRTA